MKRNLYLCSLLILLLSLGQTAKAQEVSDFTVLRPEDFTRLTLPPLDLLFENAKGAPTYELAQVQEQIQRKLLAKEKRAFLGFFSLRGSYQYGMFGNESTFTDVATVPYLSYSTAAQNGYTVGAGLNIPLDGLFDLSARIKRQKLNVRSAELQRELKFEEQKKEIVQLYATATAQLNVLRLRSESLILSSVQYDIAEKDFTSGRINSSELSTEKEKQAIAQERFEGSKFELTKSLMILEIITNTPILRK